MLRVMPRTWVKSLIQMGEGGGCVWDINQLDFPSPISPIQYVKTEG